MTHTFDKIYDAITKICKEDKKKHCPFRGKREECKLHKLLKKEFEKREI